MKYYVYALRDPSTGEARYIGKTDNPKTRLCMHLSLGKKGGRTRVSAWVKRVLDSGSVPTMDVLKAFNSEDAALVSEAKEIRKRTNLLNGRGFKISKLPKMLPLTEENHKGLRVLAATQGKKLQEAGNDLVETALETNRVSLRKGEKMPKNGKKK